MTIVKGPDFIALQVPDVEKSANFYSEVLGLPRATKSPPGAVLFLTNPIPFAVREPPQPLSNSLLGHGIALWFYCEDSIALYEKLKSHNVELLDKPSAGPFGMTFQFKDIDGYIITMHDKA